MNDNPLHVINDGGGTQCRNTEPPFFQCCCNCKYHVAVHHHCSTEPKPNPLADSKCQCGVQKGWACAMPGDRIYDNWAHHSTGCEEHTEVVPNVKGKQIREALTHLGIDSHNLIGTQYRFTPEQQTQIDAYVAANYP